MTQRYEEYEKFEKHLKTEYPKMFSRPYGGLSIGPGWWPIVEALCSQIQYHVDWKNEQSEKYQRGSGCMQVVVLQIKEKFGSLRFYYEGGDDVIEGMVRMAEAWAETSCEECSKPGQLRDSSWIKVRCDEHEAEYQKQLKQRGY